MNDEHGGINGQMPMPSHSCKCLNIRVAATKPKNGSQQPTAPKPPREYTLVYATEDGVNIVSQAAI